MPHTSNLSFFNSGSKASLHVLPSRDEKLLKIVGLENGISMLRSKSRFFSAQFFSFKFYTVFSDFQLLTSIKLFITVQRYEIFS